MIYTFFSFYPDEILYGCFSRYHSISGNIYEYETMLKLFGKRYIWQDIIYTVELEYFCEQFPEEMNYSADYLINNHSLYSLYKPFLTRNISEAFRKSMKQINAKKLKSILSINSNFIPKAFKICPTCFYQDRKQYGEAYMHRTHQVQGVFVCPIHGTNLISINYNKWFFWDIEKVHFNIINNQKPTDKIYLQISKDVYRILNDNILSKYTIFDVRAKYIQKLREKGYYTNGGLIRYIDLINDFKNVYSDEILINFNSNINIDDRKSWIRTILINNKATIVHPIRHLLLIYFLFGNLEEFNNYKLEEWKLFGNSPWPCLNKCCTEYKTNTIESCNIKKNKNGITGFFNCPICGFEYTRLGPDKSPEDRYRMGSVNKYGHLWEERFLNALSIEGISQRKIAEIMKCSRTTIRKQTNRLVISKIIPKQNHEDKKLLSDKKLNRYKKKILKLLKDEVELGRSEIIKRLPTECRVIREGDKDWYEKNMPANASHSKDLSIYYSEYWKEKDKIVSESIKNIVKNFTRDIPSNRITITYIGKVIDYHNLGKYIGKLPLSQKLLNEYCETPKQFKDRKQGNKNN